MTSADDDGGGWMAAAGGRRGSSAERGRWDGPWTLSDSRVSLSSNRDSGIAPSPAGAVSFELDSADGDDWSPAAARRGPVSPPIAIPGRPSGLPPPEEASALLLRRRRQLRTQADYGSEDEGRWEDDDEGVEGPEEEEEEEPQQQQLHWVQQGAEGPEVESWEAVDEPVDGPAGWVDGEVDEVDQAEAARQDVALLRRETRSLQVGWREGAVLPRSFTFRAEFLDMMPPRYAAEDLPIGGAEEGGASASAPVDRRRPRRPPSSRASSASLTVELDVGQELREIADSLHLSRSAPGALLPRRDIWTLLRRTLSFRIGREMAPRPRQNSGRQ